MTQGTGGLMRSGKLFARAKSVIPGGVNSPVRAFGSVASEPIYIERGQGSSVWDVEGNEYIDFLGSWGPLIFGHAHERIVEAVSAAARRGTSFGANIEAEVELAERVVAAVPSIEVVRMVNSGTEAAMSAIRLARGATGRSKIVKFDGCYHGHADSFLIRAGSGLLTLGIPGSPGVTEGTANETLVASFNEIDTVREILDAHGDDVAAIVVEPVMGNASVIPPESRFLEGIRRLATESGAILIFDEVITGFRVAQGGAQELYGINPDLTCLGKIIGGGLPVGAFGGRRDLMELLAPTGPVYQAGTLSGNPIAVAGGLETLKLIEEGPPYDRLEALSARLQEGMEGHIARLGLPYSVNRIGSMMSLNFSNDRVRTFSDVAATDTEAFDRYFSELLNRRVYVAPSAFEAIFVSVAHTDREIDLAVEAIGSSLEVSIG